MLLSETLGMPMNESFQLGRRFSPFFISCTRLQEISSFEEMRAGEGELERRKRKAVEQQCTEKSERDEWSDRRVIDTNLMPPRHRIRCNRISSTMDQGKFDWVVGWFTCEQRPWRWKITGIGTEDDSSWGSWIIDDADRPGFSFFEKWKENCATRTRAPLRRPDTIMYSPFNVKIVMSCRWKRKTIKTSPKDAFENDFHGCFRLPSASPQKAVDSESLNFHRRILLEAQPWFLENDVEKHRLCQSQRT